MECGALQWLSGQGGLTLPTLDAAGLLTFALETVGLSYAGFTHDLETAFTKHHRDGARLVGALDTLYQYAPDLHDLAAGGPGQLTALAGHLMRKVTDLNVQALVFDQVKAVLGPQLLLQVAPTLVGYLIPGADVAEAVGAVVRLIGTIVSRAAQLEAFAAAVCGAIDTIAGGGPHALTRAAGEIEGALVKAVPLVLAFAAGVVGVDVSRIGAAVLHKLHAQELVDALHKGLATLADAVAALLLKAVPPSVLARLEGHAAPTPGHATPGPAHGDMSAAPDKPHDELHLVMHDAVAAVNAYAGKPVDEEVVRGLLTEITARHEGLGHLQLEPLVEKGYWAIRGSLEVSGVTTTSSSPSHPHAGGMEAADAALAARSDVRDALSLEGSGVVSEGVRPPGHGRHVGSPHRTVTETDVTKARVGAAPYTQVTHQPDGEKAGTVTALPLTLTAPLGTRGTHHRPQEAPPGWTDVLAFDEIRENAKNDSWQPAHWVKVHLLSDWLHGPGKRWNLAPGHKKDNDRMESGPEQRAKDALLTEGITALYYQARVTFRDANPYSGPDAVDWTNFPKEIHVTVATAKPKDDGSGEWEKDRDLSGSPFIYDRLVAPRGSCNRSMLVDLNTASRDNIERLQLPTGLARQIEAEDKDNPFDGEVDFLARMKARYNALSRPVDFESIYWPMIKAKIDEGKATF